ncbi:MAG: Mrp/NBP35 family ATP-binding protein [Alphaproteobacteria bacterium]|nr:Mrp/NBP35 family ATP-binding protein [Alphaproteobacteria bacterium]
MSTISRDTVLQALRQVPDSTTTQNVVDSGRVSGVVVRGGKVGFVINTTAAEAPSLEPLRQQCESAVMAIHGVEKVTAVLTAVSEQVDDVAAPPSKSAAQWNRTPVAGVRQIIAVASGKGGVGKSTATVCLAKALRGLGMRVGILDADIYGPSIPLMMGLNGQPEISDNMMQPLMKEGIACMSIGFILGDEAAVMRAPMITKALTQMLRQVAWGELDILLVDMPPGTGDVHISMVQQAPLNAAIIVTTPQKVATLDAHKAIQMFDKIDVPVVGIIENMSYLQDSMSGEKSYPFGKGGGEALAKQCQLQFLGQIPLEPRLGEALDKGDLPETPKEFSRIASQLKKEFS